MLPGTTQKQAKKAKNIENYIAFWKDVAITS